MGNVLSKGSLFPEKLANDVFNKVQGKSTLAKLSGTTPLTFVGKEMFTFAMDKDIDIVAENGAKSNGGATLAPVHMIPIKVEYGARVSDEFMHASEEEALDILTAWREGFAKKLARGLDIMAMHRLNPRTGQVSTLIPEANAFDTAITGANVIAYDEDDIEGNVEDAVSKISGDNTGYAFGKTFAAELGKLRYGEQGGGTPIFPEFRLGGNPDRFNGVPSDVNSTVEVGNVDKLIVGDFANAFKYGFAKGMTLEVIEYGNPDNDAEAGDLKGHNQVYIRSEAYLGWAILDPSAFSIVAVQGE